MKRKIILMRRAHTENHKITQEGISKAIKRATYLKEGILKEERKVAIISSTDNVAVETLNLFLNVFIELTSFELLAKHASELLGSYVMERGYEPMMRKICPLLYPTTIAISHATVLENATTFFEERGFKMEERSFALYPEPLDFIVFSNF
ncbi:MAG: hypothetical protein D6769_01955 [Methanobacteriota archaeon]|nr:MAG: hypothetical protein D6769_01955 [Euryarchaeota archaeon]